MKRLGLVEAYPMERLRPHPDNYRQHDLSGLKRALRRGQHRTVVVLADEPGDVAAGGTLLAGHGVYFALSELGRKTVAATVVECDAAEAIEIVVEDNRTQERGSDNPARLADLLGRIEERGRLKEVGYSHDDLAALVQVVDAQADEDSVPVAEAGDDGIDATPYDPPPRQPGPGLGVDALRQVVLGFPIAAAHERFLESVATLRGRYGIETSGVTPVVVRAMREQTEALAEAAT